jgi:glycosyltransferase involved in cell wall biosynthesis
LAGTYVKRQQVLGDLGPRGQNVEVVPWLDRSELRDLLGRHDVLVLPSWSEGMPLVALEAAAAGLAVIATNIPGNVDIFRLPQPERDGALLFPPGTVQELAERIARLADDRGLVTKLGERARARASDFTWSMAATGLHEAYERALTSARLRKGGQSQARQGGDDTSPGSGSLP